MGLLHLSSSILALISVASALGTNDQVLNPTVNHGTFSNPSSQIRPKFRYWVPDASANLSYVQQDIAEAGRIGAGGLEFLGYYLYGNPGTNEQSGPIPVDWNTYGWGTEAWKTLQDGALRATVKEGLVMDIPLGPNQGAGVPAPADSEGLLWTLSAGNATVQKGQSFNGVLPSWGKGRLVAAVTGVVTKAENTSSTFPSIPNDSTPLRTQYTLSTTSLADVSTNVSSDGRLSYTCPNNAEGLYCVLFTYYLVHTEYREQASPLKVQHGAGVVETPPTDYRHNGSWVVDHFSTLGAQTTINFWEQHLLTNDTRELLRQVGNYGWEDSQEFGAAGPIFWTPLLPDSFLANRGYDIKKYMPILLHGNAGFQGGSSSIWYITDEFDGGEQHVADYRTTLQESNTIYLSMIRGWLNDLGLQWSAQVGYNLPVDMPALIPEINVPECECLDFADNIDAYRQFSGAANLAGKRIISSECGANRGAAFQQTVPSLLWELKRSFAGGVNQFNLHGYPYSGPYPNTTWPGFVSFDYLYSEQNNRHQPGWDYFKDFMDYVGRNQWVLQGGVPKVDVAFWLKVTNWQAHAIVTKYLPNDPARAGYTYDYLSPDDFALPTAYVANKTLAPTRQGFKALVLRANESLTVEGVTKLEEFAKAGLPIVFSGGVPSYLVSYNASGAAYVNKTIASITSGQYSNVHLAPYDNLAATLSSIGITPRTRVATNTTWYTFWRQDATAGTDYVFVYNDGNDFAPGQGHTSGTVTFEAVAQPYLYDAWTGESSPILNYQRGNGTVTVPLELAGNQTAIIGFNKNVTWRAGFSAMPAGTWAKPRSLPNSATVYVPYGCSSTGFQAHNGSQLSLPASSAPPMTLTDWNLTVEAWLPPDPSNLYLDSGIYSRKVNSTYIVPKLLPWSNISSQLYNVSGRGYYSASFSWPPSTDPSASGAMLNLGAIFHTARALVNGRQIPPLDVTWAKADIGSYLINGTNTVQVIVSTPFGNGLRPYWGQLRSSGTVTSLNPSNANSPPKPMGYGLVVDVTVTPYREYEVQLSG